jgi:hypothetical protein
VAAATTTRHALGTAVFSGITGVTLFGVFQTPVFFHVLLRLGDSSSARVRPIVRACAPWFRCEPQVNAEVPAGPHPAEGEAPVPGGPEVSRECSDAFERQAGGASERCFLR